jgi:formate dehydrogenase major subunit
MFNSRMGSLDTVSEDLFRDAKPQERIKMPAISDQERRSTEKEVDTGFIPSEAREEARHCLECGCDYEADCKLRQYATVYGADQHYFGPPAADGRRTYQVDSSHDEIKMETGKCINCAACVRACAEVKGLDVLSLVNRGFATRMLVPFGRSLVDSECDGCGECVKVCPTAGIMKKKKVS